MTIFRRLLTLSLFSTLLAVAALLAMAGQVPASASPSQQAQETDNPVWGPDIRISPPNQSNFDAQRNHTLAVDPTNPNNAIAGYDNYAAGGGQAALSTSTDAGRTWEGGRLPPLGQEQMVPLYNAGVAYDAAGTGYIVASAITSTQQGYYVVTATNGLLSPARPIVITDFDDYRAQLHMAVDPRPGARNLYTFWLYTDNQGPFYHGIWGRYSHDGGMTWSNDIAVSDEANNISFGPSSAVASDGTVYVAASRLNSFTPTDGALRLYLDRSTDGGATWDEDRLISGAPIVKMGIPDYKGLELTLRASAKCTRIRVFHFPYIVVAPNDPNTVYAVWNDGRWDSDLIGCEFSGKHSDIAFSRTTDGGLTWSAPIRVNDDPMGNGIDQFHPGIGVRADGVIGVTWYDRRYDPANPYWYNLAYSQSTDGGLTWSANTRVSDISSNPDSVQDVKGIDELGFRKNVAFGPDYVLPAWHKTDPDISRGDLYTDRGDLPPNLTATPTIAATSTRTSTSTSIPPTSTSTSTVAATSTATSPPTSIASGTSTSAATTSTSTAMATTVATSTPCPISFSDVGTDNPFYAFIRCLSCRGIISGYSDGTFRPNNDISRGQIAKMVSNSAGFGEDPLTQIYEDVPPQSPFYSWINRLSMRGHIGGYNCGIVPEEPCGLESRPYFRPAASATRGQLAKIVANAAGLGGAPSGIFYTDVQPDNPFYLWVMRLTTLNVMSGYPCGGPNEPCDEENRPYFRPYNNVTRGQASKIVANTFFPGCQTPRTP